jgi:hypothetical protein
MKKIKTNPIKTVLTISVGFILVYLVVKWNWLLIVSLLVGIVGICSTYMIRKIDYLWMKLAWLLGQIIPNVLLGIVFYLFLFPISLMSKWLSGNSVLNLKNNSNSVFITPQKGFDKESFEKSW